MDYANMKSLLEDPDVQELLLVLGIFERRNESKNLTELCEHLDKDLFYTETEAYSLISSLLDKTEQKKGS